MYELSYILGWIGLAAQIACVVVGIARWPQLTRTQRILVVTFGLVLINYAASRVFIEFVRNSYPFFYSYIVLEFAGLALVFHRKLELLKSKSVTAGLVLAVTLFSVLSGLFVQTFLEFPSYARTVESVLIVVFCVAYLVQVMRQLTIEHFERTFIFWLTAGLLIYFAANALITLFGSVLATISDDEVWGAIWSIHGVLNILLYLSCMVALLCRDDEPVATVQAL